MFDDMTTWKLAFLSKMFFILLVMGPKQGSAVMIGFRSRYIVWNLRRRCSLHGQ